MGLLILESTRVEKPPGTVVLFDDAHVLRDHNNVKLAADGFTVLVPQPSDDAAGKRSSCSPFICLWLTSRADPLNWPFWRKEAVLYTLIFCVAVIESSWPTLSSSTTILANEFDASIQAISFLTGPYNFTLSSLKLTTASMGELDCSMSVHVHRSLGQNLRQAVRVCHLDGGLPCGKHLGCRGRLLSNP